MFAGSTPTSTPRYSSVVNGRRPSTHFWAGTPGGWSTHAPVHRAATDSAGEGAADNGKFLGVSGATGGRTVAAGAAAVPGAAGWAVAGTSLATMEPLVPLTAPIAEMAPTTTASSSTALSPSRAGERNGHCQSTR